MGTNVNSRFSRIINRDTFVYLAIFILIDAILIFCLDIIFWNVFLILPPFMGDTNITNTPVYSTLINKMFFYCFIFSIGESILFFKKYKLQNNTTITYIFIPAAHYLLLPFIVAILEYNKFIFTPLYTLLLTSTFVGFFSLIFRFYRVNELYRQNSQRQYWNRPIRYNNNYYSNPQINPNNYNPNPYPNPQFNRFNKIENHKALMDFILLQLYEIRPNTNVNLIRFYQVLQNEGLSRFTYYDYKTIDDIGRLVDILIKTHPDFEFDKFNQIIVRKEFYTQVPIGKSTIQTMSDSEFSLKEKQISSTNLLCPYCHIEIAKTHTFCPDCGYKLVKCPICKGILKDNDQLGQCPSC